MSFWRLEGCGRGVGGDFARNCSGLAPDSRGHRALAPFWSQKAKTKEVFIRMASILMPQPDLPFEGGIIIDATRLKPAFVLDFWRQNGANCRCFLTSGAKTEPISCETSSHHPTATFEPPKRHWFWDFLKLFSERPVCSYREPVFAWPLHSLTATWRAKKRHSISRFFKNLSLLLYRNIQSKKVNTASKTFPLLLNSHMRGLENDIELRFFRKALYSLTATSEAKKRHQFLKVPRKFTN